MDLLSVRFRRTFQSEASVVWILSNRTSCRADGCQSSRSGKGSSCEEFYRGCAEELVLVHSWISFRWNPLFFRSWNMQYWSRTEERFPNHVSLDKFKKEPMIVSSILLWRLRIGVRFRRIKIASICRTFGCSKNLSPHALTFWLGSIVALLCSLDRRIFLWITKGRERHFCLFLAKFSWILTRILLWSSSIDGTKFVCYYPSAFCQLFANLSEAWQRYATSFAAELSTECAHLKKLTQFSDGLHPSTILILLGRPA